LKISTFSSFHKRDEQNIKKSTFWEFENLSHCPFETMRVAPDRKIPIGQHTKGITQRNELLSNEQMIVTKLNLKYQI